MALLTWRGHCDTTTVCKCDGKKCGEVKILSNLVPLAVKFAGLTQGTCCSQGYTEKTGEVLKVKTPIGTIESPVYIKAVGEIKRRLDRVRRRFGGNKYTGRMRSKAKYAKPQQRPISSNDYCCRMSSYPAHKRPSTVTSQKITYKTLYF